MEEILYRYNPWWEEKHLFEGAIERETPLEEIKGHLSSKQVVFLTGIRRVGKTTLLKLLIKHLIEQEEIEPSRIFYVSLDDYLLSKKSIIEIVEEYRKARRLSVREKIFLFFDEVSCQKEFEQQLKNLYDSQNVKIYASSSSSSILKSRKPYLTGRSTTESSLTEINRGSCKSPKLPFDKLRVNGSRVEIIVFSPFVVSLSNHKKDFCKRLNSFDFFDRHSYQSVST